MSDDRYPAWPELFRWLTAVKDRLEDVVAISAEQVVTGTLDPNAIPELPWSKILKAGSSLADLETRSASALTSGTLLDARMPALTGDVSSTVGTVATTLATVNSTVGTFGSGTTIPVLSVNGKGLVTGVVAQPITTGALTRVNDTNITATLGGTPATALLKAVSITLGWTGTLAAARLNANVVQSVVNDTNVTGAIATQVLTLGWTGTLGVTRGGTGTGTAFTAGSVVFAGASGVYSQDNAHFFWDNTAKYLGLGAAPSVNLQVYADATSPFGGLATILVQSGDSTTLAQTVTRNNVSSDLTATQFGSTFAGTYAGVPFADLSLISSSGTHLLLSAQVGDLIIANSTTELARITNAGNLGLGVSAFGSSAVGVFGMVNATAPGSSPVGMGQLYVDAGALKFRGSGGTVTTVAPA